VQRLGAALCLTRNDYSAASAAAALERLLKEPSFAERAGEVGLRLRDEDGLAQACDALEIVTLTHDAGNAIIAVWQRQPWRSQSGSWRNR